LGPRNPDPTKKKRHYGNWQYFIMKPCRCFNCAIRFCLSLVAVCLPGWLLVSSVSGYLIYCQIGWPSAGWPSPWLRHIHKYVCGERFLLSHFFFCFSAFSRGSFDFVSLVFGFWFSVFGFLVFGFLRWNLFRLIKSQGVAKRNANDHHQFARVFGLLDTSSPTGPS